MAQRSALVDSAVPLTADEDVVHVRLLVGMELRTVSSISVGRRLGERIVLRTPIPAIHKAMTNT